MMDSRGVGVVEGCTVYTVEDVKIQYVAYSIGVQYWLRLKILTLVIVREPLYPEGIAPELIYIHTMRCAALSALPLTLKLACSC